MNAGILGSALNGRVIDGEFVPFDEMDERTFICENCGEIHLKDYAEEFDEQMWCEDCLNESTFICENCGERHYNEDAYNVYRNGWSEMWCEYCADTDAVRCAECGDRFAYDDTSEVRGGERVCESCLEDNYHYCYECDEYVTDDDWDWEAEVCLECSGERASAEATCDNARVRPYHCPPPMRWFGEPFVINGLNVFKGIGIELEVDQEYSGSADIQSALNRICEIASERLYFEHDGSLNNGFEIITQPHTLEAFEEIPWADIMSICMDEGFSSHDIGTCGLHVHFSREMFGDDVDTQDDNIAKLTQFIEMHWDDMVKVSRRTEAQLHWTRKKGTVSKKRIKDDVKFKNGGHYDAVNNSNNHTVEVRLMRGTLNVTTFKASIDLLTALVRNACRVDWDDICEAEEMLDGVKSETLDYLVRQGAFIHAISSLRNR